MLLIEPAPTRRTVRITYRNDDGTRGVVELEWRYMQIRNQRMAVRMSRLSAHSGPTQLRGMLEPRGEEEEEEKGKLRRMREWVVRTRMATIDLTRVSADEGGRRTIGVSTRYSELFSAQILRTKVGRIGRLRFRSFDSFDIVGVGAELRRVLRQMPKRGLVVDIRGNGAGVGEMVKAVVELVHGVSIRNQVLSVRSTRLVEQLVSTARGQGMNRARRVFIRSFEEAVGSSRRVKEEFSGPVEAVYQFAFAPLARAYFGPVVTVVDGRTYSAGDIYAKLMVDEGLSVLVGVDANVGAGGASSVLYSELVETAPRVFQELGGGGVDFGTAFARVFRGGRKSGVLVERFGVRPDVRYYYTRRDTLEEDCELFEFLGGLLVRQGSGGTKK